MKYKVKKFFHEDFVTYKPGEEIELTEKRAAQLGNYVEKIEEIKPKKEEKSVRKKRI